MIANASEKVGDDRKLLDSGVQFQSKPATSPTSRNFVAKDKAGMTAVQFVDVPGDNHRQRYQDQNIWILIPNGGHSIFPIVRIN